MTFCLVDLIYSGVIILTHDEQSPAVSFVRPRSFFVTTFYERMSCQCDIKITFSPTRMSDEKINLWLPSIPSEHKIGIGSSLVSKFNQHLDSLRDSHRMACRCNQVLKKIPRQCAADFHHHIHNLSTLLARHCVQGEKVWRTPSKVWAKWAKACVVCWGRKCQCWVVFVLKDFKNILCDTAKWPKFPNYLESKLQKSSRCY